MLQSFSRPLHYAALKLAPQSSCFQHEPLDQSLDRPIRILTLYPPTTFGRIRCSIACHELESAPPFHALSYMWGPPGDESTIFLGEEATISLGGRVFPIRRNLWLFLRHLCFHEVPANGKLLLWADGICIDQTNLAERNHQVGLMGQIYTIAESVFAWLGEKDSFHGERATNGTIYSAAGLEAWCLSNEYASLELTMQFGSTSYSLEKRHPYLAVLSHFCKREYWTRTWILQEILLARKVVLFYQGTSIRWDAICDAAQQLRAVEQFISEKEAGRWKAHPDDPVTHPILKSLPIKMALQWRASHESSRSQLTEGIAPVQHLLDAYVSSQCSVIQDKFFALIAMSTDCQKFPVDYSLTALDLCFAVIEYIAPTDHLENLAVQLAESLGVASSSARLLLKERSSSRIWNSPASPIQNRRRYVYAGRILEIDDWNAARTRLVEASDTSRECHEFWRMDEFICLLRDAPREMFSPLLRYTKAISTLQPHNLEHGIFMEARSKLVIAVGIGACIIARSCPGVRTGDLLYAEGRTHEGLVIRPWLDGWLVLGRIMLRTLTPNTRSQLVTSTPSVYNVLFPYSRKAKALFLKQKPPRGMAQFVVKAATPVLSTARSLEPAS